MNPHLPTLSVTDAGLAVDAPAMFPAAARTPRAIVVSYSTVPDGWPGGEVGIRRSLDDGATWEAPRIVATPGHGEDAALGALGLTALRSGELLLPYNTVTWTPGRGVEGCKLGLHLIRSGDDGASWSPPQTIDVDFYGPAVYGEFLELDDGEILWPVWGQRIEGETWSSIVLASTDLGAHWRAKGVIAFDADARLSGSYVDGGSTGASDGPVDLSEIDDPDFRPHDTTDGFSETSVVAVEGGRLLAIPRQQGVGGDQSLLLFRSFSDDGGTTWTPFESLGFSGTSPALFRNPDGTLLLGTRRFVPDASRLAPAVELRAGSADGLHWSDPLPLEDPFGTRLTAEYQCGYPAIVEDGPDRVLVYFYSYLPEGGRYVAWNRVAVGAH